MLLIIRMRLFYGVKMFNKKMLFLSKRNILSHKNLLFRTIHGFGRRLTCNDYKIIKKNADNFPKLSSNLKIEKQCTTFKENRKSEQHRINSSHITNEKVNSQEKMESYGSAHQLHQNLISRNLRSASKIPRINQLFVLNNISTYILQAHQRLNSFVLTRTFSTNLDGRKAETQASPCGIINQTSYLASKDSQASDISSFSDNKYSRLYTAPKNVLHNAYDVVAQELNNKEFKLKPSYSIVKEKKNNHSWSCTYQVKWPEPMKFVSTGQTKQEASHKAAICALLWLKKAEKITKDGHPIIVGKSEIKEITKSTAPKLNLKTDVMNKLKTIIYIHQNEFVPALITAIDNQSKNDEINEMGILKEPSDVNFMRKQKLFGFNTYLAKEKVHLPISNYKEEFISLLAENRVVIVKGEPGCGKSTRIPQYVLESWARQGLMEGEHCCIAVTQPRRIAAISLAERVSNERDEISGHIVGYQIRLKSKFNPKTGRILYCTTGILLRHLQSDPALSNFSFIILDEAHERDVNTDLLMNLLRNTLQLNPKLKLIVMSATIDTDMFKDYFENAPVMHIPGFTYPVKTHFLDDLNNLDLSKTYKMCNNESPNVIHEDVVKVINYIHKNKSEGAILCFLPGWEDIARIQKLIPPSPDMSVLCLHSRLQDLDQWKVFSRPPPGVRKVILSTNIAETSVTIDDIVYVIDTGTHKENRFDNEKGVKCIDNYWISQSSMWQRRGRAGRVQPGESFHLYTKAKFASFLKFTEPEILKTSLTKIILDSKVYSNNMDALEFMSQLPSPPDKNATRRAVRELKDLQLLDDKENLTSLGKTLATFQLEPKLAKVLVNAVVYKCVTPIVDIVTLFSADTELFATSLLNKELIKKIKSKACQDSDHLAMMRLFEKWLELMEDRGEQTARLFCSDANLVHHKLDTMNKLRQIHFDYLHNGLHDTLPIADDYSDNDELVKAILFSGVGTLLKHRNWDIVKGRVKKSNVFLTNYSQKASLTSESVNFKKTSFSSDLLVYFNEIRSNIRRTTLVRECSVISPLAVLLFSDKKLITKEVSENSDQVLLSLKDTKVEFLCSKEEAENIQKCKEALEGAYQYFIFQMTEGGEVNSKINEFWDKILENINSVLS